MSDLRAVEAALLVLVALTGSPGFAETPEPPTAIRFAWEPGLRVDVRAESSLDGEASTLRYRLSAAKAADGMRIVVSEIRPGEGTVTPEGAGEFAVSVARAGLSDILISSDGQFGGLADAAEVSERLRDGVKALLPPDAKIPIPMSLALSRATAPETLAQAAAAWWAEIVGFWAGKDFKIGATYRTQTQQPHPVFPTEPITMSYEFRAARRLACREGAEAARCVELQLVAKADPAEIDAVAARVIDRLNTPAAATSAARPRPRIDLRQELTVVAEPGTLKPYALVHRRITTTGEGESRHERVEERRLSFDYPAD
jgi:hypothetical protein